MGRHRKRSSSQEHQFQVEAVEVDDLAVAATFARFPILESNLELTSEKVSQIQRQIDESEGSDTSQTQDSADDKNNLCDIDASGEKNVDFNLKMKTNETAEQEQENDSDIDDSDDDLCEASDHALTHLDDYESEEEEKLTKLSGPKTENEIDPYQTPIDELQSNFQLNLTVEEEEHLRLAGVTADQSMCSGGVSVHLCTAGRIISHMVNDRTIVIESEPNGKGPLDEGSLIVIRINEDTSDGKPRLLPLGKVFEVFGPISRPLYTIRLPQPQPIRKKQKPANLETFDGSDENEIALSDEESNDCVTSEKSVTQEEEKKCLEALPPPDHWARNGKYTSLLNNTKRQTVFYIQDEARILDTFRIMRTSGKGCDASNLYDEEVQNANELYFSDDEEERQFKRKGKKSNSGKWTGRTKIGEDQSDGDLRITGFHQTPEQCSPQLPHNANTLPPAGFHPNSMQPTLAPFHQTVTIPYSSLYQYNAPVANFQQNLSQQTAPYQDPALSQQYAQAHLYPPQQQYSYPAQYQYPTSQQPNEESDTVYY